MNNSEFAEIITDRSNVDGCEEGKDYFTLTITYGDEEPALNFWKNLSSDQVRRIDLRQFSGYQVTAREILQQISLSHVYFVSFAACKLFHDLTSKSVVALFASPALKILRFQYSCTVSSTLFTSNCSSMIKNMEELTFNCGCLYDDVKFSRNTFQKHSLYYSSWIRKLSNVAKFKMDIWNEDYARHIFKGLRSQYTPDILTHLSLSRVNFLIPDTALGFYHFLHVARSLTNLTLTKGGFTIKDFDAFITYMLKAQKHNHLENFSFFQIIAGYDFIKTSKSLCRFVAHNTSVKTLRVMNPFYLPNPRQPAFESPPVKLAKINAASGCIDEIITGKLHDAYLNFENNEDTFFEC